MPSNIMMIQHIKSVQDQLNSDTLPTHNVQTMNDVLERVGLSKFKSSAHHNELFIFGKHTINFGIDDIIDDLDRDMCICHDEGRDAFSALAAKYDRIPLVLHIVPGTCTFDQDVNWRDH
jgi:hypothetical protein